jgi:hypothetical protein
MLTIKFNKQIFSKLFTFLKTILPPHRNAQNQEKKAQKFNCTLEVSTGTSSTT